jgi:hypothetical protein
MAGDNRWESEWKSAQRKICRTYSSLNAQGFTFTDNGKELGPPARTLNEFVSSLAKVLRLFVLDGHARCGDFSQWIGSVFHGHVLSSEGKRSIRGGWLAVRQIVIANLAA